MRGTRENASLENSLHMLRDGSAMVSLTASSLKELDYKGEIYNFPPEAFGFQPRGAFRWEDLLTQNDLVVCATRLALTDSPEGKKKLIATGLDFEQEIHTAYAALFARCDRGFVILSDRVAQEMVKHRLDPSYRAIRFEHTHGARYTGLKDTSDVLQIERAPRVKQPRNIGYIAYLPRISNAIIAGIVTIFSLDGTSTALWASIVARRFKTSLLDITSGLHPRLIIGEFTLTFPRNVPYTSSEIKVEFDEQNLIDLEIPLASSERRTDLPRPAIKPE
jgi:hypothetical protein